jgi:hypothetical protein
MIKALRDELVPIIIVVDLLAVWSFLIVTGQAIPDNVNLLVTAVTVFYFGSRTGAGAATRALNGAATTATREGGSNGGT